MKFYKLALLAVFFISLSFTSAHKYYVSITEIEYVEDKKSVQIITRIFVDDFQRLLRERYDDKVTLDDNQDEKYIDTLIEKYLLKKMQFEINGKQSELAYLGKEYDNDIVYCYLEIEKVSRIKRFEVQNKVLFDLFEDQKNVVRTNIYSKPKTFVLNPDKDKGMLNFN